MAFKPLTYNTPPEQEAHILAEDDAAIYEGLMGKDCVFSIGEQLKASTISNNKVRLSDGVVSVGGHIGRILKGDYEDMTIANGISGKKRNDIIAARFIASGNGGADSYKLVVVQGTPGTEAVDPVLVKGDLYGGDKQRDYPLYRVQIDGISIVKVEQMFEVVLSNKEIVEKIDEKSSNQTLLWSGSAGNGQGIRLSETIENYNLVTMVYKRSDGPYYNATFLVSTLLKTNERTFAQKVLGASVEGKILDASTYMEETDKAYMHLWMNMALTLIEVYGH